MPWGATVAPLAAGSAAWRVSATVAAHLGHTIDRRTFLKRSGLAVGAGAAVSQLPFSMMGKAKAAEKGQGEDKKGNVNAAVRMHSGGSVHDE